MEVRPVRGAGKCRGSPAASKPPFVVGSNCAIFGTPCGGGHPSYRSVAPPLPHKTRFAGLLWGAPFGCAEKRKRLLMVSREKTLAAAFQAPPEMPFPACYGGYLGADLQACVHSIAYGSCESWGWFRMLCRSLLLPQSGGCGGLAMKCANLPPTAKVRQRKEKLRVSGNTPSFFDCHMRLSGQSPQVSTNPNPRNRRCERSGRSPECRRQSLFLLHHQKAHSLFPLQEKENGGFEAAGLPRHSRPDGKRF